MLKAVKVIDYKGSYAYSPGVLRGVINLDEISSLVQVSRQETGRLDDVCRVTFKNGTVHDIIGKPEDFLPLPVPETAFVVSRKTILATEPAPQFVSFDREYAEDWCRSHSAIGGEKIYVAEECKVRSSNHP